METYRQTIYCDLGFLETILSKQDSEMSCLDNSHCIDEEVAANVRELLLNNGVKLNLNVAIEEYENILKGIEKKRKNAYKKGREPELTPFEKKMLEIDMKRQDGKIHLHVNAAKVQLDETLNQDKYLNAMFFSCESKEDCEKAMREFGIIIICLENINDFKHLIIEHGVALRRDEKSSWNKCLENNSTKFPCNSLIVVDNYILNKESMIDENLTQILDSLIPSNLNQSLIFHLTIFSLLDDASKSCTAKQRYEKIVNILQQIRPNQKFSLTIIKCKKDKFHDRTITSSNLFLGCSGGFDLFMGGVAKKTTTVFAFHPFLYTHNPWSRKAYSDFLNDACYEFFRASDFNEEKPYLTGVFFGERKNRLLNQVKK